MRAGVDARPEGARAIRAVARVAPAAAEWDRFVASCPGGTIFQSTDWGHARRLAGWDIRRVHLDGGCGDDDHHHGGGGSDLRAAALLGFKRRGPIIAGYCQRGPVWKDPESLALLLDRIRDLAREAGAAFVKLNPDLLEGDPAVGILLDAGYRPVAGEAYAHRGTYRVDLTAGEESILRRMEGRTRRAIARARRDGVGVAFGSDRAILHRFEALARATADRRRFPAPGAAILEELRVRLGPPGGFRVAVAGVGGNDVSAAVHLFFAGRCTYMWGGSTDDRALKRSNASEALHAAAIREAIDRGASVYDLHGVPLDPRGEPSGGIALFKRGFGGAFVRLVGDFDLPIRPNLYRAWRGLERFHLRRAKAGR